MRRKGAEATVVVVSHENKTVRLTLWRDRPTASQDDADQHCSEQVCEKQSEIFCVWHYLPWILDPARALCRRHPRCISQIFGK